MDKDSLKKRIQELLYQVQIKQRPHSKSTTTNTPKTSYRPVEIDRIYQNVYKPIRDRAIAKKTFEMTMFSFMVKGKYLKNFYQKEGIGSLITEDGFLLKMRHAGPNELTLKRLSACMLYDNCMNAAEDATSNPPAGYDEVNKTFIGTAETMGEMSKYIPSMSTLILWRDIAETLTSDAVKQILLKKVQFACGNGLNFVWRIYQAENGDTVEEAGPAFAIAAYYMDLGALNSDRKKKNKAPLGAAEAFEEILARNGTFVGLFLNCADLKGPANIVDSSEFGEIVNAINCSLCTTTSRACRWAAFADAMFPAVREKMHKVASEKEAVPSGGVFIV
ncbi:hypothetical protein IscW_ISCW007703 [Ixodes scapularis]|uniref:Uncharacterized protein n=1 Tax=Ixodes scapularis TaxID=6945 RepID=B7PTF2_IXOSC|nr:hypothetical protein IscW_ISCW007703 [Ixodes scapularis]|eukprot:XP_002404326.1 hypothetical protein IscW_ISCW007703 [Ixodes scapularis]